MRSLHFNWSDLCGRHKGGLIGVSKGTLVQRVLQMQVPQNAKQADLQHGADWSEWAFLELMSGKPEQDRKGREISALASGKARGQSRGKISFTGVDI